MPMTITPTRTRTRDAGALGIRVMKMRKSNSGHAHRWRGLPAAVIVAIRRAHIIPGSRAQNPEPRIQNPPPHPNRRPFLQLKLALVKSLAWIMISSRLEAKPIYNCGQKNSVAFIEGKHFCLSSYDICLYFVLLNRFILGGKYKINIKNAFILPFCVWILTP